MSACQHTRIDLVGDSDIARWPIELLPAIPLLLTDNNESASNNSTNCCTPSISGHSGATLDGIISHVNDTLLTLLNDSSTDSTKSAPKFVVVCAGENDLGCGIPLQKSKLAFQALLDLFYQINTDISKRNRSTDNKTFMMHLIYLVPKFEPWLTNDDDEARKSYIQMSSTFEQMCQRSNAMWNESTIFNSDVKYVHYIDCLTMFCESASVNQPGAIHGGKAIPDKIYFHSDGLHLSNDGYNIWKSVIEDKISAISLVTSK